MAAGDNHRSEAERLLSQANHYTYGDGADPVTGQALAVEAIGHALLAVVARQEGEKSSREADATPRGEQPITVTAHPTRCWPCMTEDCPGVPHPVGDIPGVACGCGCATEPGPDLYSIVLAAIGTAQGPQLPLPVSTRRLIASQVTSAVAPLVAYREVWDASLPPGGAVCSICGHPVESEPCPDHAPDFFQPGHTYRNRRRTFRVDVVIAHPDTGHPVAFGWWKFPLGAWMPLTAGAHNWREGWRDITEPACDSEPPEHATTDTPGEGT
ncbi:hypothetical protein [Streptomyces tendae]|uniref:DUF35 domain-containing protein n=1 Tax=Streptomyces tendae TaxID=1932 RepID=A0ABW7S9Y3_STRTE